MSWYETVRLEMKREKQKASPECLAVRTALQVWRPEEDYLSRKSWPVLKRFLPEFSGTFLDVGCYGGWVYPHVRDRVEYTGIDPWPTAIDVSRKLWGGNFHCVKFQNYNVVHDYVWAAHLQPEHEITPACIDKLRSLSRKALILVEGTMDGYEGELEHGDNWVIFRK